MNNLSVDPDLCHELLAKKTTPALSFDRSRDYNAWKKELKEKFVGLTGLSEIEKNACPLNVRVEYEEEKDGYRLIRFLFDSEAGETVPCYLLLPNDGKETHPVAITLQGHSTGFHNSIGVAKEAGDEADLPRVAFALQAVKNGFAALAIEQRGMGERRSRLSYGKENKYYPRFHMCAVDSLRSILLGRTIIGERVWDVSKAIDALSYFSGSLDLDNVLVTGNSGGGTISYYAACYDERIKLSVPSCSFCPYYESILSVEHCACNYIPSAYRIFDMQDLAALIAPRGLIVVAGAIDAIFPIEGVRRGFDIVKKIYSAAGAKDNCELIETPNGHFWRDDMVWSAIKRKTKT